MRTCKEDWIPLENKEAVSFLVHLKLCTFEPYNIRPPEVTKMQQDLKISNIILNSCWWPLFYSVEDAILWPTCCLFALWGPVAGIADWSFILLSLFHAVEKISGKPFAKSNLMNIRNQDSYFHFLLEGSKTPNWRIPVLLQCREKNLCNSELCLRNLDFHTNFYPRNEQAFYSFFLLPPIRHHKSHRIGSSPGLFNWLQNHT